MYTLADLTRFSKAKRRSVQLWAEAGAIVAETGTEREGSGVHRLFDRNEAIIACVLGALATHGITIGKLISAGDLLRQRLGGRYREPITCRVIEDGIADQGRNLLLYNPRLQLYPWTDNQHFGSSATLEFLLTHVTLTTIVVNLNLALSPLRKESAR